MRFRLLQARLEADPVREEERLAFATRMEVRVETIETFDLIRGGATADEVCDGVDGILVGGSGAFSITDPHGWVHDFVDLLGELSTRDMPVFASCFGFQGLVVALGGRVGPDEAAAEVGTYELELLPAAARCDFFGRLPPRFHAQQGHKDRAVELPEAIDNLARSERCPHQALRVHDRPVFATQFHPELTGDENRTRFGRYYDMYARAFGEEEAQRKIREDFFDSPEANGLLKRFAELVAAGRL